MNFPEDIFEQIDQYLKGELAGDSKRAFERKLETDTEFKDFVNTQSVLRQVVIADSLSEIKSMMQSDFAPANRSSKFSNWHIWGLGVLVLSCLVAIFFYSNHDVVEVTFENSLIKNTEDRVDSTIKVNATVIKNEEVIEIPTESAAPSRDPIDSEFVGDRLIVKPNRQELVKEIDTNQNEKKVNIEQGITEEKLPSGVNDLSNVVPCQGLQMAALFSSSMPRYPNQLGILEIDGSSLVGGVAPYSYAIEKEAFQFNERFEDVPVGKYQIKIKDGNGCVSSLEEVVEIKINYCPEYIQRDFTPAFGESWSIPVLEGENIELIISNKSGRAVYNQQLTGGQSQSWEGRGDNGAELPMGFYKFKLAYPDGGFCLGKVTIIR